MSNRGIACVLSILSCLLIATSSGIASTDERAPPAGAVAQAVEVNGDAIFAATPDKLVEYERVRRYEQRAPSPAFRLAQGQWLRAGEAVMALENASVLLRWRDGSEQRLGPRAMPVSTTIHALQVPATAPVAVAFTTPKGTLASFERAHRPALLFALGAILALLPLARRATREPGTVARLVATLLFIGITLPILLLLCAAQLGRIAWYQPPMPGVTWSGTAAVFAHGANLIAFVLVFAGTFALGVLGLALGRDALARRARAWWWLALAAVAISATAFLAPYSPQLDYESAWYTFWHGWARYYAIGAWLLLPFAQLVACAPPPDDAGASRRNGAVASALLILFAGCIAVGYDADYDPFTGMQASEPATRAEAQRWLCASTHVFEGTTGEAHIVRMADCGAAKSATTDAGHVLQACEAAIVSVRIDDVLRSPSLQAGQTVDFAVVHARERLDGDNGLLQALRQRRLLFQTRDAIVDGQPLQVSAAHPGRNRNAPLGFANDGDGAYAREVIAECAR